MSPPSNRWILAGFFPSSHQRRVPGLEASNRPLKSRYRLYFVVVVVVDLKAKIRGNAAEAESVVPGPGDMVEIRCRWRTFFKPLATSKLHAGAHPLSPPRARARSARAQTTTRSRAGRAPAGPHSPCCLD
ncbi:hypothetical protein chiPu_0009217 [Chiloscyllium punctatum]|uniref:Uncharacterized protein n=1 Tax=Chiloscyllium punctatum TaxID=137246 RepID=A0A401SK42_CHIPU|nr:hypothetical protein [Chiloscyllium punctatum]